MIVDDEPIVRIALKTIINWESFGFFIASEAQNGEEAIGKLEAGHFDVIITDIKMPVIDGLDLIRYIDKTNRQVTIIVLSAYDEFTLAKDAFKLGVYDYIVKTEMNAETLTRVAENLKLKLETEQTNEQNRIIEQHIVNRVRAETIMNALIFGTKEGERVDFDIIKKLDLRILNGKLCIIIASINNFYQVRSEYNLNQFNQLQMTILNVIDSVMNDLKTGEIFLIDNEFVGLLSFNKMCSIQKINAEVHEFCQKIIRSVKKYANIEIYITVSQIQTSELNNLSCLYKQAKDVQKLSYISNRRDVIFYHHYINPLINVPVDIKEDQRLFKLNLFLETFENSYSDIFINPHIDLGICIDKVKSLYDRFFTMLMEFSSKKADSKLIERINFVKHASEFNITLLQQNIYLKEILDDISNKYSKYESALIRQAKLFIHENYNRGISLDDAATYLNVSVGHLCRVFTNEINKSFMKYLMEVRINKAKELLLGSNASVSEISELIGYSSPTYFNNLFKKNVGQSPIEYRKGSRTY